MTKMNIPIHDKCTLVKIPLSIFHSYTFLSQDESINYVNLKKTYI